MILGPNHFLQVLFLIVTPPFMPGAGCPYRMSRIWFCKDSGLQSKENGAIRFTKVKNSPVYESGLRFGFKITFGNVN